MLTKENWSYTFYKHQKLKCFIGYGAEPSVGGTEAGEADIRDLFFLNMAEVSTDKLIYQKEYFTLDHCLKAVNEKYCHWQWIDPTDPNQKMAQDVAKEDSGDKKSGCGSCQKELDHFS